MRPKAVIMGNEKIYDYGDWLSRLRLPDYCTKCKSRDVYVSHNEEGIDVLRCWNCHYSVIAPTIKGKEEIKCRLGMKHSCNCPVKL